MIIYLLLFLGQARRDYAAVQTDQMHLFALFDLQQSLQASAKIINVQ
jgi:hypothetical protein